MHIPAFNHYDCFERIWPNFVTNFVFYRPKQSVEEVLRKRVIETRRECKERNRRRIGKYVEVLRRRNRTNLNNVADLTSSTGC